MAFTVAEVIWLVGVFYELSVSVTLPVSLYSYSTLAIQTTDNLIFHERTKHIDIDCHFIREKIHDGLISTKYLSSSDQPADVLNKVLGRGPHCRLMSKLGMKNIFIAPNLRAKGEGCEGVE